MKGIGVFCLQNQFNYNSYFKNGDWKCLKLGHLGMFNSVSWFWCWKFNNSLNQYMLQRYSKWDKINIR